MNTSDVLNKAADLIEQRGWVQGVLGWPGFADDLDVDTSPLCLEGGIMAALGLRTNGVADNVLTDIEKCPAYAAVQAHLETSEPLYRLNDSARTAAEVIEVLRSCAVIEQAREEQGAAWATYAELVTA